MDREASREAPDLVVALGRVLDDPAHRDATAVRQTLLDRGWRPPDRPRPSPDLRTDLRTNLRTSVRADVTVEELLARGCSAQEVAAQLGVPLSTLADHLVRLRSAYGCTSTREALRRARVAGGAPGEH